jgi:hypothetical protein
VHFYPYGLASKNSVLPVGGVRWTMRTLDAIAEELGHADRDIDVLKMDIEEAEWGVLPTLLESAWFTRGRVKQFLIEVHFSSSGLQRQLAMLRRLSSLGYELINRDENWRYSMPMRGMGDLFDCMELSYVWNGRAASAADDAAGDAAASAADEAAAAAKAAAPVVVERPVWKRAQAARRKSKESVAAALE